MKVQQATNRLRAMIQSLWGASNISSITEAGEPQSPPTPVLLKLRCNNKAFGKACEAEWESPAFTECPKCGQRRFVHKVEEEKQAV